MSRNIVVQKFDSIEDDALSEIHRIANEEYGDFNWLYEPQKSDKALLVKDEQKILGFCLYSLVNKDQIDDYSYSDYKKEINGDSLIINHVVVRPKNQSEGIGREIMNYLFSTNDETMLCKAWIPEDQNKNKFFEKIGFNQLEYCEDPWESVDYKCLGCGNSDGCVCSGVVYVSH